MKNKASVVMYHYVRDLKNSRYPEIKGLDYELFVQQIQWFKKHFHIIRMEELIAAFDGSYELPENAVLLTFDDGYIDHYTNVVPFLEQEGIQGAFFISGKTFTEHKLLDVNKIHFILASAGTESLVTDIRELMDYYRGEEFPIPSTEELYKQYAVPNRWDNEDTIFAKRMLQTALPERLRNLISSKLFEKYINLPEEVFARELYVSERQLKTMKKLGMYIGIHGYDHYWLGNLSPEKMQEDIHKGLESLADVVNPQQWVMNYPYGNYSDTVIDYIAKNGCCMGLSVEAGVADVTNQALRYRVPRFDTNDYPPKSSNYENYQ